METITSDKQVDIVFVGGGSLGPVTPLIAVAEYLQNQHDVSLAFIGTEQGPEEKLIEEAGYPFFAVASGKLRRYLDLRNLTDPLKILRGGKDAFDVLGVLRPKVVVSAGAYVAVSVSWVARTRRIPVVIHQQDVHVGLANRLMRPFAKHIFVALEESLSDFPRKKTEWIGNPVRKSLLQGDFEHAKKLFSLDMALPTVLVLGGGTGSLSLNRVLDQSLPVLLKYCNVIHSAGKGRNLFQDPHLQEKHEGGDVLASDGAEQSLYSRYHVMELLTDEMKHAYAASDLVVCRAGMGTLTELAALSKPALVIPLPDTHQEENAAYFARRDAVMTLSQKQLTPELLVSHIRALLENDAKRKQLSRNIHTLHREDASARFANYLIQLTADRN